MAAFAKVTCQRDRIPGRRTPMTILTSVMQIGKRRFEWGARTYVMGVLNVTPDSFSGDGLLSSGIDPGWVERAADQALWIEAAGADIIDVGGESTRPPSRYQGAKPVDEAEELRRIIPVIESLHANLSIPISIDTRKSNVARAAVDAGAAMINDVSMLADPNMAGTAADLGVPLAIGHTRFRANYKDPTVEVIADLRVAVESALESGVSQDNLIIDPGIGFGKKARHSLDILNRLAEFHVLQLPVLVGTSRKSFIGEVLDLPVEERLEGTAATVALNISHKADIVRVHDVPEMVRVARMADAVVRRTDGGGAPRPT